MKIKPLSVIITCLSIVAAVYYYYELSELERVLSAFTSQVKTVITSYEQTVSTQNSRISSLESEKSRLQSDLTQAQTVTASYKQTVSGQEIRISTLESERSKLLATAQETTTKYQSQLTASQSQISSLQNRQDKLMKIVVTQHYEWDYPYRGQTWKWDLHIPLSLYFEYLERPRPRSVAAYVDMAKDPNDDSYIDSLINAINQAAKEKGFTESAKVNFVVAFIQGLPYTVDTETAVYNEYPRYPIETLFDRGGDCEDTSILAAALLDKMGYDVALLHLKDAKHMAIGVYSTVIAGSYYEFNGKKYHYLETTGEGWQIGVIPSSITKRAASVYPLRN